MIQPAFSAPENFKNALHPQGEKESYWFIFFKDQLLIGNDKKTLPIQSKLSLQRTLYVGTWKDRHIFTGEIEIEIKAPPGYMWSKLPPLYSIFSEDWYSIAGRAMQLLNWDRGHKFCGVCGSTTFTRVHERAKECSNCKHCAYPKVAPAIMACIKRGDQILLARSSHFPPKVYSVLAGFVDPGETLEQCVIREVQEEVGIKVKNIQYFASQPWPFSYSLMIAFTCEWESGEIIIDPLEIEAADWFNASNLPELPPPHSLSLSLITSCLKNL